MSLIRLIVLTLLVGLVSGCGAAGLTAPHRAVPPPVPASTGTAPTAPLPPAEPVNLHIEAIDATSTLLPLGLNPDDTIEVPPVGNPMQAGWYRYGPTPGELGPAVILGHVNGGGRDGIFARLDELGAGDRVVVTRADGSTAVFTVTHVEQIPKAEFPTEAVYGDTDSAQLRLITCGGSFDDEADSYRDNIIAFAELTGSR